MKTLRGTYLALAVTGLIFLLTTLAPPGAGAQAGASLSIHFNEDSESDSLYIGDPFQLVVEVQHAADERIKWPQILPSMPLLEGEQRSNAVLEVLDKSQTDSSFADDGTVTVRRTLDATIFDAGDFTIPAWTFDLLTVGSETVTEVRSTPLVIRVFAPPLDAGDQPRDIKQPLDLPFDWTPVFIWGLIGLGAVGTALTVWLLMRRRRPRDVVEEVVPKLSVPAHKTALNALRALEKDELWQRGEVKQYYTRISEILRTYLEERYKMLALESTSAEILADLRAFVKQDTPEYSQLSRILDTADLVKFAKTEPDADTHNSCLREAYIFVETTAEDPQAATAPESTVDGTAGTTAAMTSQPAEIRAPHKPSGEIDFLPPQMRASAAGAFEAKEQAHTNEERGAPDVQHSDKQENLPKTAEPESRETDGNSDLNTSEDDGYAPPRQSTSGDNNDAPDADLNSDDEERKTGGAS